MSSMADPMPIKLEPCLTVESKSLSGLSNFFVTTVVNMMSSFRGRPQVELGLALNDDLFVFYWHWQLGWLL